MEGGTMRRYLARRLKQGWKEVKTPSKEKNPFDPVDWEVLQAPYEEMRRRMRNLGHNGPWFGSPRNGEGTGIRCKPNLPKWKGPGERY